MLFKYSAPIHLNGNLFCAVDTETTGLDHDKNSIIEVCVLPLNSDYSINRTILPFNMQMQPIKGKVVDREAMQINKLDITKIMLNCVDAHKAADLLVEWFEKLNLAQYKRIIPIAQNWPFDRAFLTAWLGRLTYEMIFDRHFRDTMALAASYNDIADMRGEKIPFPKISLGALAKRFGIENPDPHRALGDAVTTAAVYKNLLMYNDVGTPCPKCAESDRSDPGSPEQPGICQNGGADDGRNNACAPVQCDA